MSALDEHRRPVAGPPAWLVAAPWLVCGLISTTQSYFLYPPKDGAEPSLLLSMAVQMPPWLLLAGLAPLIARLALRRRLTRPRWRRNLPIHLAANALVSLGHTSVVIVVGRLISGEPYFVEHAIPEMLGRIASKLLLTDLFAYWLIVALVHAHALGREARERALAAANLEGALAEARLEALKVQLHPHFLFNTLHAIGVLVRKQETDGALRMLSGLGELLRLALERTTQPRVPLKEELDFLDRYLAIEAVRLGDRLRVHRSIPGELLGAAVPGLLLQPLAENAIRHGIAPRARGGALAVEAGRRGDRLTLEVRDDGLGLAEGFDLAASRGIGLRNIRDRLRFLYGDDHRLSIAAAEGGGTRVQIEIPLTTMEAA